MTSCMYSYLKRKKGFALYCVGKACLLLYELLQKLPLHELSAEETESMDKRNARLKRLIRFVDENFQEYVTSVRFNAACKLIAQGGMRLLDVFTILSMMMQYEYLYRR